MSQRAIEPVPRELESSEAKLVYLYLETTGEATLDDLNETLTMDKLAVLSVIDSLSRRGLVRRDGDRFGVAS